MKKIISFLVFLIFIGILFTSCTGANDKTPAEIAQNKLYNDAREKEKQQNEVDSHIKNCFSQLERDIIDIRNEHKEPYGLTGCWNDPGGVLVYTDLKIKNSSTGDTFIRLDEEFTYGTDYSSPTGNKLCRIYALIDPISRADIWYKRINNSGFTKTEEYLLYPQGMSKYDSKSNGTHRKYIKSNLSIITKTNLLEKYIALTFEDEDFSKRLYNSYK